MAKTNKTWIAIIVVGLILLYMGSQGYFKSVFSTVNNQVPNPNNLQNEYIPYSVTINLIPTTICVGQTTNGNINSNIPNGVCSIFVKSGSGTWTFYSNANLDANGDYSAVSPILTIVGPINFMAVCCDSQGNCRMSNQIILTVNACEVPPTCTDTDGGIMYYLGGKVTTKLGSMYDTCQPNGMDLLEFYCDGFGLQQSSGIGCINGCQDALEGDYCKTPPNICFDSDSSLSPFIEQLKTNGYCTDKVASYTDHCYEGTDSLIEYYCSPTSAPQSEKSCDYVSYNCPGMIIGSHCLNGRCVL